MEKLMVWATGTIRKQLVIFATTSIIVVVFLLLRHDSPSESIIYTHVGNNRAEIRKANLHSAASSPELSLRSLVRGEDLTKLESTGLSCNTDAHTEVCVITKPITFDKQSITTISVPVDDQDPVINTTVRPYARREDEYCMSNLVSPLQIINWKSKPNCQINHNVPAIIFSFGGYSYNHFHAINDVIIPLFITSRNFQSQVQFIITDYNATRVDRYGRILKHLSSYEIIDGNANGTVRCFPSAVVGLRYHDNLAVNNSEIPNGHTIESFRQFLTNTYELKRKATTKPKRPKLLLISRQKSRKFLNEDEMVKMMVELGFQVHIALPNETTSLENFAQVVNSCDVIVGAHGAGLTNQIFLPDGSVVIQIVPVALEWQSMEYFAKPANKMGFKYIEYEVEAHETSLYDLYGPDDPVIYDPSKIWAKGWEAIEPIYVDQQNFQINLTRFRNTLVEALKHFKVPSLK